MNAGSIRKVLFLLVLTLLSSCFSSRPPAPKLQRIAQSSTTLGPGDVFEVAVMGEKEMSREYRVQPNGTIAFPKVGRLRVDGRQPQDIEEMIRRGLIDGQILLDPQVTVLVKTYNSKKVSLAGAVARPGALPYVEGLRLMSALSQVGWLTALGDPNHVILTRTQEGGKTITVRISVEAISEGQQPDIELQAGDTIHVMQKII